MARDAQEAGVARLSIAALAIDLLVISIILVLFKEIIDSFKPLMRANVTRLYIHWLAIPIAFLVHLLVVELFLGGRSVGRLALGLSVRTSDTNTSSPIRLSVRLHRCWCVIKCIGLNALKFDCVSSHNKQKQCFLHSDWIGPALSVNPSSTAHKSNPAGLSGVPILVGKSGPVAGQQFRFDRSARWRKTGVMIIGNGQKQNDFSIANDNTVSRIHCRILCKNNLYYLVDGLGPDKPSLNGTFLNNKRISNVDTFQLTHCDVLKIGRSELVFQIPMTSS